MKKSDRYSELQKDCISSFQGVQQSLEELRGQTILVTGGTGFMGKWISEAVVFLNSTRDFRIKLHLLARYPEAFRVSAPHLANHKYIHLISHDVRTVNDLPEETSYVIHAAGTPDSREHSSQPLRTIDTIVKGTTMILDSCWRLQNLRKFIYVSSNNVYGELSGRENGITESELGSLDCNSVSAAYAEAKRMGECICSVFRNQQRLPITIIRPFTFIGPYQSLEKPWAANNFMRDAILNQPIRILGNENTVRSYLYGSDMAFWILKILAVGKPNKTYNVGGDDAISLAELATKIAEYFRKQIKINIEVKSSRQFNNSLSMSVPDLTALKNDCGVVQSTGIDEAIRKTLDFNIG